MLIFSQFWHKPTGSPCNCFLPKSTFSYRLKKIGWMYFYFRNYLLNSMIYWAKRFVFLIFHFFKIDKKCNNWQTIWRINSNFWQITLWTILSNSSETEHYTSKTLKYIHLSIYFWVFRNLEFHSLIAPRQLFSPKSLYSD